VGNAFAIIPLAVSGDEPTFVATQAQGWLGALLAAACGVAPADPVLAQWALIFTAVFSDAFQDAFFVTEDITRNHWHMVRDAALGGRHPGARHRRGNPGNRGRSLGP
jgi:hypothetical protein